MPSHILTGNAACTEVNADLNVVIQYIPGYASASFTITYSTTCPAGMETDYPKLTVTANGETFGPYTSATLPASIAPAAGTINITGSFAAPVFAPVNNGVYTVELRLDAVDKCGNAKTVLKSKTFEKRPPNPLGALGSTQSGGYVEGDKAKNTSPGYMEVIGFLKDYQSNALGPDAGQKLRLRLFDMATGIDCPGYLIYDYSADIEFGADLPTGGTGSPNYGTNIGPFVAGGTGVWASGGTPGDFSLEFDKAGWADLMGFTYSQAKNLGISLEVSVLVDGVDRWSNVATSIFPVYCLEQHYILVLPQTVVADSGLGTIAIGMLPFPSVNGTDDFIQVDPVTWNVGGNSYKMNITDGPFTETAPDPSGVNITQIEYNPEDLLITFSNMGNDFIFFFGMKTKWQHKDTGEVVVVNIQNAVIYFVGPDTAAFQGCGPVSSINSFDGETCTTEIESTFGIDSDYGGGGPISTIISLEFDGENAGISPTLASGGTYTQTYVHNISRPQSLFMKLVISAPAGRATLKNNVYFQVKAI